MKKVLWALLSVIAATVQATGVDDEGQILRGDARILAARQAFANGDRQTLERFAMQKDAHVLDAYVQFWLLANKLARPEPLAVDELTGFLREHEGSVLAERLRSLWITRLMRERDWASVQVVYSQLERPDAAVRCQSWRARMENGDASLRDEVLALWPKLDAAPESCQPVLQALVRGGQVGEEAVWGRFRRQIDSRSPQTALLTLSWLETVSSAERAEFERTIKNPEATIKRLRSVLDGRRVRHELALAALVRLVRHDPLVAHARVQELGDRLSVQEQAYLYLVLGHHGALSRLPQALAWFAKAGNHPATSDQRFWRVRAALRAEDWSQVEATIGLLEPRERESAQWVYWLGRAYKALHLREAAEAQFDRIADTTGYYGLLAAEELERRFTLPNRHAALPEPQAKAAVTASVAVQRALALYRLDLRIESGREWAQAMLGRSSDFLAAAADLALKQGIYDYAINTAEAADPHAYFALRFITPFRQLVEPHVEQNGIDAALVYALIRQESRFNAPARSSAGALGLMQVMPATGKWLAKKIGLEGFRVQQLNEPGINIQLGTRYIRILLDDLGNEPVLALAGYNAGPGRARRWLGTQPLDAAIYVETIPFNETRSYVQKVLANVVVYAAMLNGQPQSLKKYLGTLAPYS